MSDTKFETGAVRSADADKFSFTSLPMVGLLALARTAGEGAEKYGRFNYLQGMPLHDLMEHSFKHLVMYNAGDRSEPHLAHAAWGLLVAIQEEVLRPEAHAKHMLGAGCSITPAVQAHLDEQKPILAEKRANADKDAFNWNIFDLADVQKLRGQRDGVNATLAQLKSNGDEKPKFKSPRPFISRDKCLEILETLMKHERGHGTIQVVRDEPMVFGQWSSGAYEHSTGNPGVDTWLNEGGADIPPVTPVSPIRKVPRTPSHGPIHSHSPLATRQQNNAKDHVQGEETVLRTPKEAFAASIKKPLEPYQNGDSLYFGHHPKSTPDGYFPRS